MSIRTVEDDLGMGAAWGDRTVRQWAITAGQLARGQSGFNVNRLFDGLVAACNAQTADVAGQMSHIDHLWELMENGIEDPDAVLE